MAQLKGILFDMDGTLVDNLAHHFASFDEFIKRKGLTLLEPVSLRINGMHSDDVFRILLGEEECKKHSLDALNREKEEVYECTDPKKLDRLIKRILLVKSSVLHRTLSV